MEGGSECPLTSVTVWRNGRISPISAKDLFRLHQFFAQVLPGIFLGCALYAGESGRETLWSKTLKELEELAASELQARRLNAKEVLTPMKNEKFVFPVADGTVKTLGGVQSLRPYTWIRDCPERGEEQEIHQGKSDELHSPTKLQDDSTRDDAEAKNDFLSITGDFIYRHHVEPRVKLYMPKEESFPIPLKYIGVTRNTRTSLDV